MSPHRERTAGEIAMGEGRHYLNDRPVTVLTDGRELCYHADMTETRKSPPEGRISIQRFDLSTSRYWVALGEPSGDPDDPFRRPEISHRYVSRRALVAAIVDGSAWL